MNPKTLTLLEYDKILARLINYCAFSASIELAKKLKPTPSIKKAKIRLEETSEARHLFSTNATIGIGDARDVRDAVVLASRGGVLETRDLLDIKNTLISARRLKKVFTTKGHKEAQREKQKAKKTAVSVAESVQPVDEFQEENYPHLQKIAEKLPPPLKLVTAITRTISDKGDLLDSASAKLASLRRERRVTHDRLMSKLRKIIANADNAKALQEAIITQRDNRYVLPLQAQFKGRIKGIIHDKSSSGATLFIEPLSTVEANNKLREIKIEERDEERRILAELCAKIGEFANEITQGVEALAKLDLIFAKAKYAQAIEASEPVLFEIKTSTPLRSWRDATRKSRQEARKGKKKLATRRPELIEGCNLLQARHPLLDPKTVVPLDLKLDAETQALVITGPNTGGKTVTLKTMGLLALMAQSGLHIPAKSGSALPCFNTVYADIGDEQSIEQSLSTFSGHIKNISKILKKANEKSLVILDELGAGTDPQEGAALARAILITLLERGSLSFVATHYPELKAFAHGTKKVTNASLEFDLGTLRPTYKLTLGLPGRSNALAIARRLGLDPNVLALAEREIDPEETRIDALIQDIHRQKKLARKDQQKAQKARIEVHRLRRELAEERSKIEDEKQKILEQARSEAQKLIESTQAQLTEVTRRLEEANQTLESIEKVEEEIEHIEKAIPQPIHPRKTGIRNQESGYREQGVGSRGVPKIGDKVLVKKLGADGIVTALGNGEAEIQVGALRLWADLAELQLRKRAVKREVVKTVSTPNVVLPKMELDLRGERADDALDILARYIDQAYIAEMPFVRIVHGKGTGRLREVVREALQESSFVKSFEEGKPQEGGAGVTVVKFL